MPEEPRVSEVLEAEDLAGWDNGAIVDGNKFIVTIPEGSHGVLLKWWLNTTLNDFNSTVPKMEEYGGQDGTQGAADLRIMGDSIATMLGWGGFTHVALEMACWFYVLGKVGRLVSDYQARREGKDDTWHDISVYAMMARRIKETGRWP